MSRRVGRLCNDWEVYRQARHEALTLAPTRRWASNVNL